MGLQSYIRIVLTPYNIRLDPLSLITHISVSMLFSHTSNLLSSLIFWSFIDVGGDPIFPEFLCTELHKKKKKKSTKM